jgi:hypothetical protein
MHDLRLLRALKESGHKWNPSVKRHRRGTALKVDIFVASRAAREDQDESAVPQNVDGSLIELGDGSARSIGMEPPCSKTHRDSVGPKSSCFDR